MNASTTTSVISTTVTFVCWEVELLANSLAVKVVLMAKCLLSIAAAVSILALLRRKGIGWIAHPNAKVLFSLHLFWVLAISLLNMLVFLFDFIRLSIAVKDPCDRLITIGFCMSTKMLTILAIVAQETSMLAFSLERAYATTYPRSYEKCQTPSVGIFVGILSIFLAVGVKYGLMLPGLNFSEKTASYEVIFAGNAELFQISLYLEMVIEGSTGIVFLISFLWNQTLTKRATSDASVLGKKYQLKENDQFIKMMAPCYALHFVLNLLVVVLLSLYPMFFKEDFLTRFLYTEICSQPFIYGMCFPLLVKFRLKKIGEQRAREPKGFVATTENHFSELKKMFDCPPSKVDHISVH